jgi:C-terminal processing protease CtpA/Prc
VYVLTSARSFSGGEGLAYLLQDMKRATVVGERTAGAANPGRPYPLTERLEVVVPNGQVLTAASRTNWEGTGVTPDIVTPEAEALRVAHLDSVQSLVRQAPSEAARAALEKVLAALREP